MKILAADDSPTMLEIINSILVDAGYSVLLAADGREAQGKLNDPDIQLVISDLNMIRMSGLELLQWVRTDRVHTTTPFVLLTTETDQELKRAAKEAGATAWMEKPYEPTSLLNLVRRLMPH